MAAPANLNARTNEGENQVHVCLLFSLAVFQGQTLDFSEREIEIASLLYMASAGIEQFRFRDC